MKTRQQKHGKRILRALKAIVIGMGALIALAVLLLAYGLYKKSVDPTWKLFGPAVSPRASSLEAAPEVTGDISLDLPAGCKIANVRPDGRRAYVMIEGEVSCPAIVVIDTVDGRVLSRIRAQ